MLAYTFIKQVIFLKSKGKIFNFFKITVSSLLFMTAVFSILHRLPECFTSENPALMAASFTLTDGKYKSERQKPTLDVEETSPTEKASKAENTQPKLRDKSGYYDSYAEHEGEAKYAVEERYIGASGTSVENCYVKNKTGLEIDFLESLNSPLTFEVQKNSDSPQVLIYHTHTSESYMDEDVDYFYESYYSRTQNTDFSVVSVGNVLAEKLNEKGIKTIHDTTVHDSTYNGSYDRSAQTIESNMNDYKDIKVVLDIHRDAIGTDECKVKPVFTYNGKKGAQIMILSGCDYYGEMGFESWQNNLKFAMKLQNTAETMYPGMTRPLSFDYFAYNEYVCDGSLLIEVGAEANSIEQSEYTAELLANVIYEVLK